jgi:multiple antibiotic resistance protein
MIELLVNGFVTLFVILDPLGLLPLFLTLTPGASPRQRRRIALKASLIAGGILLVFGLFGLAILEGLGITLGAFRVAGGLFLFWIGFELVFEKRKERHERSAVIAVEDHEDDNDDVAAFPLAIPLIAGPGAISATILLSGSLPTLTGQAGLVIVIVSALGINFVLLALAHRVDRFLGRTVRAIISRLLGVLLAALAVQFVADGVALLAQTTQAAPLSPSAAGTGGVSHG